MGGVWSCIAKIFIHMTIDFSNTLCQIFPPRRVTRHARESVRACPGKMSLCPGQRHRKILVECSICSCACVGCLAWINSSAELIPSCAVLCIIRCAQCVCYSTHRWKRWEKKLVWACFSGLWELYSAWKNLAIIDHFPPILAVSISLQSGPNTLKVGFLCISIRGEHNCHKQFFLNLHLISGGGVVFTAFLKKIFCYRAERAAYKHSMNSMLVSLIIFEIGGTGTEIEQF